MLDKPNVSDVLATALGLPLKKTAIHLNKILVLCAEHELNASTFAARVAASTRADLYACLSAAVGTHSGPRQGGAVNRVLAMLDEFSTVGDAQTVMRARLGRGEAIAGFGHKLYPLGDPRANPLMTTARSVSPKKASVQQLWDLVGVAKQARYHPASLDMGIAMMTEALGIPRAKASSLFWLADSQAGSLMCWSKDHNNRYCAHVQSTSPPRQREAHEHATSLRELSESNPQGL